MPDDSPGRQLRDDPALLELMLSDQAQAPPRYQPTNYWSRYFNETIRVLRQDGLRDFRRQPQGYFRSFGACDASTTTAMQQLHLERSSLPPADRETLLKALEFVHDHPDAPVLPYTLKKVDLDETAARVTDIEGQLKGALPLTGIAPDLVGNPWHSFAYRGRRYTHSFLAYYMRYAYLAQFVDFSKVDAVVELGSGAGNQVEILKKLYPHLAFYLVDLAPYLYICHQFLASLFPGDVLDYRESPRGERLEAPPGRIAFVGNWRLGDLRPAGRVLFWNAASFGEMEPEVVSHYVDLVKPWSEGVFLYQCMGGKEVGQPGKGGVLEPTRFEHYQQFLGGGYRLVDRSRAYQPLRFEASSGGYDDALWVRKEPAQGGILKSPGRA